MIIVYGMAGNAFEAAFFMGHAAIALVDNNRKMFVSWVGTDAGKPILGKFAKGSFSDPYYRIRIPTDEDGGGQCGINASQAITWIDTTLRGNCAQKAQNFATEYSPLIARNRIGSDPYGALGVMYSNCVELAKAVLGAADGYSVLAQNGCFCGLSATYTVHGLCQDAARMRSIALAHGTNDPQASDPGRDSFFEKDAMRGQNYEPWCT